MQYQSVFTFCTCADNLILTLRYSWFPGRGGLFDCHVAGDMSLTRNTHGEKNYRDLSVAHLNASSVIQRWTRTNSSQVEMDGQDDVPDYLETRVQTSGLLYHTVGYYRGKTFFFFEQG